LSQALASLTPCSVEGRVRSLYESSTGVRPLGNLAGGISFMLQGGRQLWYQGSGSPHSGDVPFGGYDGNLFGKRAIRSR